MTHSLVKLSELDKRLAKIETLPEAKQYDAWVAAAQTLAKELGMTQEEQNKLAEYRIRGMRRGGKILRFLRGTTERVDLKDVGLKKKQSHHWQLIESLPDSRFEKLVIPKPNEDILISTFLREAKRLKAKKRQKDKAISLSGDGYQLIAGDFRKKCVEIPDGSVDAIITDPPYGQEFIELYGELAEIASKKMKPDGNCLVMTGQSHLPTVFSLMGQHLTYQWTIAYLSPGSSVQVFGRHVKSNWKPVLWYTNGKCFEEHVEDTVQSSKADKQFHVWGQNVTAMIEIVKRFTYAGALVLDPFVGGGATAAACIASGRQFIGIDIDQEAINTTAERLGGLHVTG